MTTHTTNVASTIQYQLDNKNGTSIENIGSANVFTMNKATKNIMTIIVIASVVATAHCKASL